MVSAIYWLFFCHCIVHSSQQMWSVCCVHGIAFKLCFFLSTEQKSFDITQNISTQVISEPVKSTMSLFSSCRKRWEGLVHISELRREGRVANVADVVSKGQRVKIKVLSFTGSKTSLSMKVRRTENKRFKCMCEQNSEGAFSVLWFLTFMFSPGRPSSLYKCKWPNIFIPSLPGCGPGDRRGPEPQQEEKRRPRRRWGDLYAEPGPAEQPEPGPRPRDGAGRHPGAKEAHQNFWPREVGDQTGGCV